MSDPTGNLNRAIRMYHEDPLARAFCRELSARLGMVSISSALIEQMLAYGPLLDLFDKARELEAVRKQEAEAWESQPHPNLRVDLE